MNARLSTLLSALAAVVLTAGSATAQAGASGLTPERSAAIDSLKSCIASAEETRQTDAVAAADAAWSGLDAWRAADPDDPEPLVGQAQVLLQCRLPFAPFMEQGALSAKAAWVSPASARISDMRRPIPRRTRSGSSARTDCETQAHRPTRKRSDPIALWLTLGGHPQILYLGAGR